HRWFDRGNHRPQQAVPTCIPERTDTSPRRQSSWGAAVPHYRQESRRKGKASAGRLSDEPFNTAVVGIEGRAIERARGEGVSMIRMAKCSRRNSGERGASGASAARGDCFSLEGSPTLPLYSSPFPGGMDSPEGFAWPSRATVRARTIESTRQGVLPVPE